MEIPGHIQDAMYQAACIEMQSAEEKCRPSYLYRPVLSRDGNQWYALMGANLHEGVAGFGASPAEAFLAFDAAWHEKIGS